MVGTASWLTSSHLNSESSPKNLGYTHFRQGREADTHGDGVFVLVKDTFIATEQKQLKTNCEPIWVKIDMVTTKPLYVAVYYHIWPKTCTTFHPLAFVTSYMALVTAGNTHVISICYLSQVVLTTYRHIQAQLRDLYVLIYQR